MYRAPVPASIFAFTLVVSSLWCGCTSPADPPALSGARLDGAVAHLQAKERKLRARGIKAFDKPQDALDFFLDQRIGPDGETYPMTSLRLALDGIQARESVQGSAATWSAIGPGNIGGRTRALAIDPTDGDTLYAAGVAGGIWKSTDAGASWTPRDDLMINLAVTSLAVSPHDPDVVYAGTGEGIWGGGVRGLGVFKSVDAGETWSQLPGTVNGVPFGAFHYVNKIRISPNDPDTLYAATRTGVWRSVDAGATWQVALANPTYLFSPPVSNGSSIGCTDLAVRTDTDPDVLFAAFGNFESDGLFRSEDGGVTWVNYTVPSNQGRMTIAIAPSDNDIIYLCMADNGSGGGTGQLVNVFRTEDGGDSWTARVDLDSAFGPWLLTNLGTATGCINYPTYSQGWYDNIIAVDPVDPDVVWVGGIDLFRSDDGGVNWGLAAYYYFPPGDPLYVHADMHNLVFDPGYDGVANTRLYATNDGGLFRTENPRAATSQNDCPTENGGPLPEVQWTCLNHGYAVTQFYHGDAAPLVDLFVAGAQDNGTSLVDARDTPDAWDRVLGGDGGYVAIHPTDPQTIYAEIQFMAQIRKSTDGGESWMLAVDGIGEGQADGVFIVPFAMDPSNPQILWTGGRRAWRTTNGAILWTQASDDLPGPGRTSAIAVAPNNSNVVYFGYDNGYIARTTNGLATTPAWSVLSTGLPIGAWVSSIAVDPFNGNTAYATYSNFGIPHIYRTADGGATWTSIDGIAAAGVPDIPVHWIAVRPCDSTQLFAGTELGVFTSDDTGATWTPMNTGLAHTIVETLVFRDHHTLAAFTHGRGAFVTGFAPCASCPADVDGDGATAVGDIVEVITNWGPCPPGPLPCRGDTDGDGVIDVNDLIEVVTEWGECPNPGAGDPT